MAILVSNNASSYLAGTLTTIATSLTVSSGTGSLFPTLSGSDIFYVTLTNSSNQYEIVKVTARATDTFTIVRAQDGTSALSFAIGDKVELRLIKAVFDDKASLTGDNTFSGVVNIVANTSSDALRITQTGAGNALVVEDSTNPDSTPFVVDSSGNVGIGLTANAGTKLQVAAATNITLGIANATTLAGAITLEAINNARTVNIPMELRATNFAFTGPSSTTVIDSSGNVGIGTSSPSTKIQVVGGTTSGSVDNAALFLGGVTGVFGSGASIYLSGGAGTSRSAVITGVNSSGANNAHDMTFSTSAASSSPTERMRIRSDGGVSIGGAGLGTTSFYVQKPITGGVTGYGIIADGSVQNDVTSAAYNIQSQSNIASGTALTTYTHFRATEGTISGTVTNQIGFDAVSDLISATNNFAFRAQNTAAVTAGKTAYGFLSNINTATGGGTTYGFYAAGTANNYFEGSVGIGIAAGTAKLNVNGFINTSSYYNISANTSAPAVDAAIYRPADGTLAFVSNAAERMRIASSGNVGIGATSPTGKLQLYNSTSDTGLNVTSGSVNILINAQNGSAQGQIGTTSSHPLSVVVSGTERMRVDTAGDVSIGTSVTSPIHYGGTAVGSTLSLRSTSASGTTDAVTVSTASQVERMRIDTSGIVATYQPAQTTKAAAATLTAAELQTRIIQYTGAAATLTLPTGTNLESVIASGQAVNTAFDITFINTGAGTLTIGANGNTTVGTLTLATLTSATFRFRKTATNTFTVYRL